MRKGEQRWGDSDKYRGETNTSEVQWLGYKKKLNTLIICDNFLEINKNTKSVYKKEYLYYICKYSREIILSHTENMACCAWLVHVPPK